MGSNRLNTVILGSKGINETFVNITDADETVCFEGFCAYAISTIKPCSGPHVLDFNKQIQQTPSF